MSLLDAIAAAAANLQSEQKREEPKGAPKSAPKAASKREESGAGTSSSEREQARGESRKAAQPKASAKAAPKSDTQKQKGGASYVIPAEFKQAIEDYLNGRPDMADKLKAKGKSIDGCCDYIFDIMRKRAEKERNGKSAVGMYVDPQEVYGLACHYYDETDEDLKNEK